MYCRISSASTTTRGATDARADRRRRPAARVRPVDRVGETAPSESSRCRRATAARRVARAARQRCRRHDRAPRWQRLHRRRPHALDTLGVPLGTQDHHRGDVTRPHRRAHAGRCASTPRSRRAARAPCRSRMPARIDAAQPRAHDRRAGADLRAERHAAQLEQVALRRPGPRRRATIPNAAPVGARRAHAEVGVRPGDRHARRLVHVLHHAHEPVRRHHRAEPLARPPRLPAESTSVWSSPMPRPTSASAGTKPQRSERPRPSRSRSRAFSAATSSRRCDRWTTLSAIAHEAVVLARTPRRASPARCCVATSGSDDASRGWRRRSLARAAVRQDQQRRARRAHSPRRTAVSTRVSVRAPRGTGASPSGA